jgi:hypothetical protein
MRRMYLAYIFFSGKVSVNEESFIKTFLKGLVSDMTE